MCCALGEGACGRSVPMVGGGKTPSLIDYTTWFGFTLPLRVLRTRKLCASTRGDQRVPLQPPSSTGMALRSSALQSLGGSSQRKPPMVVDKAASAVLIRLSLASVWLSLHACLQKSSGHCCSPFDRRIDVLGLSRDQGVPSKPPLWDRRCFTEQRVCCRDWATALREKAADGCR